MQITYPRLRHYGVVFVVFGVTGALAVLISRLLLNVLLGMEGSLWSGPWSYRIVYLALIPPAYSATLVIVGTLFGKRDYFQRRVLHVWGRLLPARVRRRLERSE